jgi:hypothetical protein
MRKSPSIAPPGATLIPGGGSSGVGASASASGVRGNKVSGFGVLSPSSFAQKSGAPAKKDFTPLISPLHQQQHSQQTRDEHEKWVRTN